MSIGLAFLVLGGFCLFWRGPMPFEHLISIFARLDEWEMGKSLAANPETLRRYYSLGVGVAFLTTGLLILSAIFLQRLSEAGRDAIYRSTITLAVSSALMIYLDHLEFEGPWAPIGTLMRHPSTLPIFGHRLLFVWIAKAFQFIFPTFSDLRCFYLSQCVASLLMVYALGKWSALHIGKAFSWTGQILGVVMISTCFRYQDFYDIAVVFFSTCGLWAIYARRYWLLVPVIFIGTWNYEGVLLLIPVAAYIAYHEHDPPKGWLPPIIAALLAYASVRFTLQTAIPFSKHFDWRIWSNMTKPFMFGHEMVYSVFALAGWYAVGAMSLAYCDPRLRPLTILLPLIFAVTFLFGQIIEPRQFDAFIPVLVSIILSASRRRFEMRMTPRPLS